MPPKDLPPARSELPDQPWQRYAARLYAFWKFSRPHTVIGTSLSVVSLYLLVTAGSYPFIPSLISLVLAWIACLCGNIYIVGLNQMEDIDIDRINKPHLPLASGEFSVQQAQRIVILMGFLAITIATTQGYYLLAMVGMSLLIGTAYSLPPIRLKRFPFWASVCILSVRGAIVNLGLFLHFNHGFPIPNRVWLLTLFILVFSFAIAIFKDIPDTTGDRQFQIRTFTLTMGQSAVFNWAYTVLMGCYFGVMTIAAADLFFAGQWLLGVNLPLLLLSHGLLAGLLTWRTQSVDLQNHQAVTQCYQFIWKLFFLEYLIFPLACWWV